MKNTLSSEIIFIGKVVFNLYLNICFIKQRVFDGCLQGFFSHTNWCLTDFKSDVHNTNQTLDLLNLLLPLSSSTSVLFVASWAKVANGKNENNFIWSLFPKKFRLLFLYIRNTNALNKIFYNHNQVRFITAKFKMFTSRINLKKFSLNRYCDYKNKDK